MGYSEVLYDLLHRATDRCSASSIALSGGLDSSILSFYLQNKISSAIAITTQDYHSPDLPFCKLLSEKFDLPLVVTSVTMPEILDAIHQCILILKNFNNIEIRNSIVIYLALCVAKKSNITSMVTGDGADELFAGYNFMQHKTKPELSLILERIWKNMKYTSIELSKALNITLESPFLDPDVVQFAKQLPIDKKIQYHSGKKFGKWILRETFDGKIPDSILWREKTAMQDGSGTSNITNYFEQHTSNEEFESKKTKILNNDHIRIQSKESLYYYEIYCQNNNPPIINSDVKSCPFCNYSIPDNGMFCRMCGAWPI